jgi:hypothetical protein
MCIVQTWITELAQLKGAMSYDNLGGSQLARRTWRKEENTGCD